MIAGIERWRITVIGGMVVAAQAPRKARMIVKENEIRALADEMTRCYAPSRRSGDAFAMPTCMNVTVRDAPVARLDEYLDSAQLGPLQTD
jgi:ketosteroid isomerase-like protein